MPALPSHPRPSGPVGRGLSPSMNREGLSAGARPQSGLASTPALFTEDVAALALGGGQMPFLT